MITGLSDCIAGRILGFLCALCSLTCPKMYPLKLSEDVRTCQFAFSRSAIPQTSLNQSIVMLILSGLGVEPAIADSG
jgi:hypothetical protein